MPMPSSVGSQSVFDPNSGWPQAAAPVAAPAAAPPQALPTFNKRAAHRIGPFASAAQSRAAAPRYSAPLAPAAVDDSDAYRDQFSWLDETGTGVPRTPFQQMQGGRGYAEPFSPLGTYNYREANVGPLDVSSQFAAMNDRARAAALAEPGMRQAGLRHDALMNILQGNRAAMRGGREEGEPLPQPWATAHGAASEVPGGTLGRYTRPLAPGFGMGSETTSVESPQERLARIEGAIPMGRGGLVTQRMAGPGEVTALTQYLRDVVAAEAGQGAMPGAFRGQIDPEAMAEAEGVAKARRLKRRGGLPDMTERRTRVALRAQGLPFTAEDARIEMKLAKNEPLTPAQEVRRFGPSMIPRQLAEAQVKQQEMQIAAQREGSQMAALTALAQSNAFPNLPRKTQDVVIARLIPGMAGGGAAGAPGGGGSAAGDQNQAISDFARDTAPEILNSPIDMEKRLKLEDFSQSDITKWGRKYYGKTMWDRRNWGFLNRTGKFLENYAKGMVGQGEWVNSPDEETELPPTPQGLPTPTATPPANFFDTGLIGAERPKRKKPQPSVRGTPVSGMTADDILHLLGTLIPAFNQ